MSIFYAIRYTKTLMASDVFKHIKDRGYDDYVIFEKGNYRTSKKCNAKFEDVVLISSKELNKVIQKYQEAYPTSSREDYKILEFDISEPA